MRSFSTSTVVIPTALIFMASTNDWVNGHTGILVGFHQPRIYKRDFITHNIMMMCVQSGIHLKGRIVTRFLYE